MRNVVLIHRATLVLSLLTFSLSGFAQTNASLHGTVTDPSGAAIPAATVDLASSETGLQRKTTTASDGVYQFLQVPPGTYSVEVQAAGFKSTKIAAVTLLVNTPATADIMLQVGTQSDQVTVTSEAAILNTSDATMGAAFGSQQVTQLPIESRNVVDLLSLQAGVVYTGNRTDINTNTDTRSGSVNGARSDQTTVSMDGVDVTDQAKGLAFTSVLRTTPDSLEEFRVVTTNPTAVDGSSSGASVKLVTKGGTNAFHGSLYEFNRNTDTTANDYFVKLAQLNSGQPNTPPQLIRNVFGASYGGPIKKNRMFFFSNYEGRRDAEAQSDLVTVPTATLRQGIVQYLNAAGGAVTVSPQTLTAWDPQHIGPNSTVLKYLQSFPLPNDTSTGDGLNFSGYRFAAPSHNRFDVYIARLDYQLDAAGKHRVFWRGSLQNDYQDGVPFLPGQGPETVTEDRGKGYTLGYTDIIAPSIVNEVRYGYTRASLATLGDSSTAFLTFGGMSNGVTRSSSLILPVHNWVDNLSWVKGNHTIQFGGDAIFITEGSKSYSTSFSSASLSASWLDTAGVANTGSPFDPAANGGAAVAKSFQTPFNNAIVDVMGLISEVKAQYNYDRNGNVLPQGAPIDRHYAIHNYDFYIQDSYRIKPNLTVVYGVRYQLESPPWETNGTQVTPNVDFSQWLRLRQADMNAGITGANVPLVTYSLGGAANNKPGFYNYAKLNFAPRLAVAYNPRPSSPFLRKIFGEGKTSIRAGAGIAYDHFGTEIISTFDQKGAYGLSTSITNPGTQTANCVPRVTSLTVIPTQGCASGGGTIFEPAPPGGFPQTPSTNPDAGGFGTGWTSDSSLKTPYVYMLNFAIERQLSESSSFQVAYVGHLSHRLLSQEDFAMPADYVDPGSGVDYFSAATRINQLALQNTPLASITNALVGPTAAYWNDLYAPLAANGTYHCKPNQCTPLQAAYDFGQHWVNSEVFYWYYLDPPSANYYCPKGCSSKGPYVYTTPQFWSLTGWTSLGNASYHSLQLNYRKRMFRGFQYDLNYTWSRSEDLSSDATRVAPGGGTSGIILNSWSPGQMKGVSDFDMTQQFNANYVAELPFGRGQRFGGNVSRLTDTLLGGWQLSGLYRVTSGLPYSVSNGSSEWPTNGSSTGYATSTGVPVQTATVKAGNGSVYMFENPTAAFNSFQFTNPGQSGNRNILRGDGYLGWDSALSKRWHMPYNEHHSLQLRWEVFNVGNFTRFNVRSNTPSLTSQTSFGKYTGLLTNPRVMQFALRYEF